MMPKNRRLEAVAIFAVALAIAGFVGMQVVGAVTSDDLQEHIDHAEQWCDTHNGELVNVQAVVGGGLHCNLPNGTVVHFHDMQLNGSENK